MPDPFDQPHWEECQDDPWQREREDPIPAHHPDYDRWVDTWGQRVADEENSAWLQKQRDCWLQKQRDCR